MGVAGLRDEISRRQPDPDRHCLCNGDLAVSTSSQRSARRIHKALKKKILQPLGPMNKECGTVYFMQDMISLLIKIGITKRKAKQRMKEIMRACGVDLELRVTSEHVTGYQRVESLVQTELQDYRRLVTCNGCGRTHKEYFEVSIDLACSILDRWIRFMKTSPYDQSGLLKPVWRTRLQEMAKPSKYENSSDHEARAKRWLKFLNTSPLLHFLTTALDPTGYRSLTFHSNDSPDRELAHQIMPPSKSKKCFSKTNKLDTSRSGKVTKKYTRPGPVTFCKRSNRPWYDYDKILNVRRKNGKLSEVLVKWLGWPEEDSTWCAAKEVSSRAIRDYYRRF